MLVDEKCLLLHPAQLDPEIRAPVFQWRAKRDLLKTWSRVDCDLLWSGGDWFIRSAPGGCQF